MQKARTIKTTTLAHTEGQNHVSNVTHTQNHENNNISACRGENRKNNNIRTKPKTARTITLAHTEDLNYKNNNKLTSSISTHAKPKL